MKTPLQPLTFKPTDQTQFMAYTVLYKQKNLHSNKWDHRIIVDVELWRMELQIIMTRNNF